MGMELTVGLPVALLLAMGGWIWRLSWKLATQDGRIIAASTAASNASARATILEQKLAEHREHVAAEYLSKDSMREITEAINRLGDRLDGLFLHFMPRPQG